MNVTVFWDYVVVRELSRVTHKVAIYIKKPIRVLGVMVPVCNPSAWEAE